MDSHGFDQLSNRLSGRFSRRTALRGGSAGFAAVALGALAGSAAAQEATPATQEATPVAGAATSTKTIYLFAQPFDSGTWSPNPGEPGTYLLTLKGDVGQTVYFSDRPERIFGLAPTQQFLDGLGFSPTNPPNAAIIAEAHGDEDQLIIELHDPVYDEHWRFRHPHVLDPQDCR